MPPADPHNNQGEYGPCQIPGCGAEGTARGPYTLWHKVLMCADDYATVQRSLDLATPGGNASILEVMPELNGSRIGWPTFWTRDRTAPEWLIEPIIPARKSVALYAKGGLGKSELTLALVAAAATGRRILNRPPGEPVRTLYLDLEQTEDDLYDRLTDLDYGPDDNLEPLAYEMLPDLPPLDTAEGGDELLQLAADHKADLVVVDTTARMLQGAENDADTIRDYDRHTGKRLKATGFTTLRVDHAGKDLERGMRGTSAKRDDVDLIWRLTHRDRGARLTAEKRRANWLPPLVDLIRYEDPLRYELALETWPEHTVEVAFLLDSLDVPLEASRRTAGKALRGAGERWRNDVIGAAQKWRNRSGTTPGTTPPGNTPGPSRGPEGETLET